MVQKSKTKNRKNDYKFDDEQLEQKVTNIQSTNIQSQQKNNQAQFSMFGQLKMQKPKHHEKSPETILQEQEEMQKKIQIQKEKEIEREKQKQLRKEEKKKREKEEAFQQKIQDIKEMINDQKQKTFEKQKKGNDDFCKVMIGLLIFCGLMMFFKIQEAQYLRQKKISDMNQGDIEENFYEIFGISSQSSQDDIKKTYRSLVLKYHPDKNPKCGKECDVKFQKISQAYDVLRDPQKRKDYDMQSGAVQKLKSSSLQITQSNLKQEILDQDHLWLIQVYDDVDEFCQHIADGWESAVKDFKGSVKFGRIHFDDPVLQELPIKITYVPTIFSWDGRNDINFFKIKQPYYDCILLYLELRNFIKEIVPNQFKEISNEQFEKLKDQDKPQIFLKKSFERLTEQQIYQSFRYHQFFDFNVPQKNFLKSMLSSMKQNFAQLIINDQVLEFDQQMSFNNVIQQAKINQIITLDRENYFQDCDNSNYDNQLCVILINSNGLQNNSIIKQIQNVYSQKLYNQLKENQRLVEHYDHIQFLSLDLKKHYKVKMLLRGICEKKNLEFESLQGFTFDPIQKQIAFLDFKDFGELNDSLDAILDHDYDNFIRIKDFTNETLNQLLNPRDHSLVMNLFYTYLMQLVNYKMLLLLSVFYALYYNFVNAIQAQNVNFAFRLFSNI